MIDTNRLDATNIDSGKSYTPIIAITAYMPQLRTKAQELLCLDILKWVHQDIIQNHKNTIILMGGELQAPPAQKNERSHYLPLTHFCDSTGLTHLNPDNIYTYITAKTR